MSQNIHGHKVLDILSEQSFTREDLKSYIVNEYGEDVRFHTCKTEGLDFDTLFDFFIKMKKINGVEGLYSTHLENKCSH